MMTQEERDALDLQWEENKVQREALQSIKSLEATVTQRRIRDAIAGADNGWLADIESQIEALRELL